MVKILVLQQLYNLADDALEYQLPERRSYLQFLDLTDSNSIPDTRSIWLFHDRLALAGVGNQFFEQVQQQLQQHGYMARCGQIVDASLVQGHRAAPIRQPSCRFRHGRRRRSGDSRPQLARTGLLPPHWFARQCDAQSALRFFA